MSCIWKLFQGKKSKSSHSDLRIQNPLNLDEVPDDINSLKALEGVLMDNLISLHYKLEQTKQNIKYLVQTGRSNRLKDTLAKRAFLTERKRVLEIHLQKVQIRLTEMNNTK